MQFADFPGIVALADGTWRPVGMDKPKSLGCWYSVVSGILPWQSYATIPICGTDVNNKTSH